MIFFVTDVDGDDGKKIEANTPDEAATIYYEKYDPLISTCLVWVVQGEPLSFHREMKVHRVAT